MQSAVAHSQAVVLRNQQANRINHHRSSPSLPLAVQPAIQQPINAWRQNATSSKSRSRVPRTTQASPSESSYLSKDRREYERVYELREQAQAYMDELLDDLRNSASGSRGPANGRASRLSQALKSKLSNAIEAMQEGLVERDAEVRLMLLAAMSGEHILFIGPPGTAKSEVGRRLNRLVSGSYFERLLTRFSVPEELFGPLSMRALEEDKYVRQTRGYLPEAEVAFIDEIFKANSAILNTLLTLVNERMFDNGSQRVKVPLISLVGASNELPESEELDALYDRFLVRRQVKQVSASGVAQMLTYYATEETAGFDSNSIPSHQRLDRDDIKMCKQEAVRTVRVPPAVIQLITDLRTYLQEKIEPPVYVSDRRLVKSIQLLQVAAFCNGRDVVTEYDCLLLQHVLWQRPEQADKIADWVMAQLSVDDGLKQVNYLLSGVFSRACRSLGKPDAVNDLLAEVAELRKVLSDKYTQVANNLEGGFPSVMENLWWSQEDGEALATTMEPKLSKTRAAVEQVLFDVATLEVALQNNCDPVTLANLLPRHWANFIKNGDISEVKPIGTTPMSALRK